MKANMSSEYEKNENVVAATVAYFSPNLVVSFADTDPVAKCKALQEALASLTESDIVKEQGYTCFLYPATDFAYLGHLIYGEIEDDKVFNVRHDGISPYEAVPEGGTEPVKFNRQMVTLTVGEA